MQKRFEASLIVLVSAIMWSTMVRGLRSSSTRQHKRYRIAMLNFFSRLTLLCVSRFAPKSNLLFRYPSISRHLDQFRKRIGFHLSHYLTTMRFYRNFANS
ncbi:hypothetical protein OKW26_001582 [Paraburkholderia sp. 32]